MAARGAPMAEEAWPLLPTPSMSIIKRPISHSTLPKSINGVTGTFVAGSLGIGEHCMASVRRNIQARNSGNISSAATFSRFMPSVKAQFNYGAMMFILTFSLVLLSGYRVNKLFEVANQRLSTRVIGTSFDELHWLIHRNMEKLTESLEVCFRANRDNSKKTQACQWVLNSKASEESTVTSCSPGKRANYLMNALSSMMYVNFARWELIHDPFNFQHPWKEYLKIGALLHNRACFIEALNGFLTLKCRDITGMPASIAACSHSCNVSRELSMSVKTMTDPSKIDLSVDSAPPLMGIFPLATLMSLLTEIAARIEDIVEGVVEWAELAEFKASNEDKMAQTQSARNNQSSDNPSSKTEPWRPFQRPEFISISHLREISRLA
ncbi:hypothetical protein ACJRO7_019119 [Eucalyptus globulus]|uniref:Uncharacterized protein n=1 Tax=Eucalyptus globulus TaxID=34317 RepID=A0ABD3KDZ7_EUCGL